MRFNYSSLRYRLVDVDVYNEKLSCKQHDKFLRSHSVAHDAFKVCIQLHIDFYGFCSVFFLSVPVFSLFVQKVSTIFSTLTGLSDEIDFSDIL